jgi:hypothetical protein
LAARPVALSYCENSVVACFWWCRRRMLMSLAHSTLTAFGTLACAGSWIEAVTVASRQVAFPLPPSWVAA